MGRERREIARVWPDRQQAAGAPGEEGGPAQPELLKILSRAREEVLLGSVCIEEHLRSHLSNPPVRSKLNALGQPARRDLAARVDQECPAYERHLGTCWKLRHVRIGIVRQEWFRCLI